MDILKKYASDNYLDRTFVQFVHSLEQGRIGHTDIPGWMLIRSACVTCDEPVTALRHRGVRYELVASGTEHMGKNWVIHQCPLPEIDAQERADIEQEMRSQHWPDDPDQRDGDGETV
jgi:hypothetical protein